MESSRSHRIDSIDLLRGAVMVIMALDHARAYFNYGSFLSVPTDLATTTPLLFFTRWITHFCAPVFVFLAGTASCLYGTRRGSTGDVSRFLLTRGLWLVFLEITLITFAWTFDVTHNITILQVIWSIGIGMVVMSALVFLPKWAIIATGALLVAGHNALDGVAFTGTSPGAVLWYVLHQRAIMPVGPGAIFFVYPVIPWIGLMALGYGLGGLYQAGFDPARRRKLLVGMGLCATGLFVLLRAFNFYGDPGPWVRQDTAVFSFLSFLNTTKYPPSLLFLLMTIGPALLFLGTVERVHNRVTRALVIIGRVPLFFYVVHIMAIHLLALLGMLYTGGALSDMILKYATFSTGSLLGYGFNLAVVYSVWIAVVALLYPLCRRYNDFKSHRRTAWWISYV